MLTVQLVRAATFGCAVIIAAVIAKVLWLRYRRGEDRGQTLLGLASYTLLVVYVALGQTPRNFGAPLTYITVLGQLGLLVGAAAALKDYVVVHLPSRLRRRKR